MIQEFVDKVIAAKPELIAEFQEKRPDSYDELVKRVVEIVGSEDNYGSPDPKRITVIDHGDYQGTRLYVIGANGYQPSAYWTIFVSYGSCSGCDTFEANNDLYSYDDDGKIVIDPKAAEGNYTMMLHMVQSMKEVKA